MSARPTPVSTSLLLLIFGVWLITQSVVGDLPRRLLSWRAVAPQEGA